MTSLPVFSGVPVTRYLVIYIYMFCGSLFVPLYFFHFAIGLSVLLRYTVSDYPFGIVKLFKIIVLARLRVVDSDNLDDYK